MADYTFTTLTIEPKAELRWSKDGGHTWSNWVIQGLGRPGERLKRAIWRRLGGGRDFVFEVRCANTVRTNMIGATIQVTPES